jgi:HSP20 family molecular chaperone IbpA
MCIAEVITKELDEISRRFYEFVNPAIDVFEEDNDLVVAVDLPGFTKKDINLRIVEGNILSIQAKRKSEEEEHMGITYYKNRPIRIDKKIALPISVKDTEKVVGTAKYADGVLTVRIPIPKSTRIEIT